MSGTPFSALAFHMSKNGLSTAIYHESEELFENKQHVISDIDFELSMKEYKEHLELAEKKGTKIINGIDINTKLLKEKLEEGNLVILAGEILGGYHAILLTGYDETGFKVCDPLYKNKQTKTFEEIEKFMNTSIGKWFITVNKNKEKEKLLNHLDKFNTEAKELMTNQTSSGHRYVKK